MTTRRWLVFDTNVYIAAMRGGLGSSALQKLQEDLPRTYLASVVAAELRAGSLTESARKAVHESTPWRSDSKGDRR
jgi:predicted nucleic acid-binding protein